LKTGKTYQGIGQTGGREKQRERIRREREREKYHWWREEMAWLEMTVGKIDT
jgi:hypothetical protein